MPPVHFKNLAAIDLKSDSTVQYTRNLQDLVGAVCTPTIPAHPVVTSYSDDFNRAGGGGFQSGNWRNIRTPAPVFPPIAFACTERLTGADAQWFAQAAPNAVPPAPDDTIAGEYIAAAPASNWHVKATFNGGVANIGGTPSTVNLLAPITQLNPADPNPSDLQITSFAWTCSWISGLVLGVDARFQFRFIRWVNGVLTNIGAPFTSAAGAFNIGSTWEFYCLCNNAPNPPNSAFPTTLIGIVDGVTRVTVNNTFNVPAGVPGLGGINQSMVPGTEFNVSEWSADELAP